ncbi:MAG: hypothetical protein JWP14_3285 [Frankiales bacterium]|nr:hypothetical protein [Frankiales bacterium]
MRHPHESRGRMSPDDARRGRGPGGGGGGGERRGRGGPRGQHEQEVPSSEGIDGFFAGRLPDSWGTPDLRVDRDEITVRITIESPETDGSEADVAAAEQGRISRWREETRDERIQIAREAEHRYGRKVAWGATAGGTSALFTHLAVPVMTRLRQPERQVLDTLVDSGVARSRAEALAWCVKLVGEHADSWLADLRQAMEAVQQVREQGPGL